MRTVDDYMDLAKTRLGVSDRGLSLHLGLAGGATNNYRTKRAWPSEETILKLAALADVPEDQALMDLNAWRSRGKTREIYERLAAKIAATAALFLFCALLPYATSARELSRTVYIMGNRGARFAARG